MTAQCPDLTMMVAPPRSPDLAGPHASNRNVEWTMAVALLGFGLMLAWWPTSLPFSAFSPILDIMRTETIAAVCVLAGGARCAALWFNGDWPIWGPLLRAIGAAVGAVLLLGLAFSMIEYSVLNRYPPSPSLPFFLAFAISEIRSAGRAAADARRRLL